MLHVTSFIKSLTFLSCLFFTGTSLYAQKTQSNKIDLTHFQKKELEIAIPETTIELPYKAIHVTDKRADTSFIGFYAFNQPKSRTKNYLVLKNGHTKSFTHFFTSASKLDPTAKTELLIVIRKFWLSKEIEHKAINETTKKEEPPFVPGIITRFEFYAKNETMYVPLLRFDSTFKWLNSQKQDEDLFITSALATALQKLAEIDPEIKLSSGIKKTFDEIELFSKINIPVLSAKTLKKGIYSSYDEFRNNNPSIPDFEIRKDSKSSLLIAKDANGQEYPARKIWGFCDGEKVFIKSIDNFFELHFLNGTIYSRASKQIIRSSGKDSKILSYLILPLPIADGLDKSGAFEQYGININYYQLDTDNGRLY
ncbi:hypothetical protein [Lacibacter sp. H407]|uniref:hypothetical protein n=1 Tax=Lacibacter sp. H407 TaxID=3133423 RepID=UPI0030C56B2D